MDSFKTVDLARENLHQATLSAKRRPLPPAGWRWHSYCLYARQQINRLRTPLEVIRSVQLPSTSGFESRMTGAMLDEYVRKLERDFSAMFPQFPGAIATFHDWHLSNPETVTLLNGRLVSSPLYNHVLHVMRCVAHRAPIDVIEIGGGYGAPGRVWMTNGLHRPRRYIDVDFPESLFYAEVFLRETLPKHDIVYLHEGDFDRVEEAPIVLCPISNIEALTGLDIDLVLNTGSMQEMSDEYVAFYCDWIDRSGCQRFYSCNYFAQPLDQLSESMNLAAPVMSRAWTADHIEFLGGAERGIAEMIFSRAAAGPAPCNASRHIGSLVAAGRPRSQADFLDAFDAARRTDQPDVLMSVVSAAVTRMPHIPKEVLYLARRAQALAGDKPLPLAEQAVTQMLEQVLASGRASMGVVDAHVAEIRLALISNSGVGDVPLGRLNRRDDGIAVEIELTERPVRDDPVGVIERVESALLAPKLSNTGRV